MLRLNNRIVSLLLPTSQTPGVATAVLKSSPFRISSALISNSLKNSTKLFSLKGNNIILTSPYQRPFYNVEKVATRQRSILKLFMNSRNSFRNSFSTLQPPKDHNSLHSTKNSHLRNNSTASLSSASSSTNNSSTESEEISLEGGRSVTERFKILTKKYGMSAITVYLIISAIDLGLTFILIQIGGADRVKKIEDWFAETFGDWIVLRKNSSEKEEDGQQGIVVTTDTDDESVIINVDKRLKNTPSWASTFVIAYGIHKLLVPLRLGLTAAITPALVRKLKRMGWNIGGKHL
ncbi:6390_t:CDS:1 [Funneliformis geosporum]|uniref:13887_t:CDS:1 n=1 Tax=Funneliformis geosporum TaxID=1117311 RepID=A0A9W4SM87_9GLOM|nr:13887_t:CDS:1 [Funneliformis geosporum]CAI2184578.1 6390_t:CDS:1 [Funneliformis geosporum]